MKKVKCWEVAFAMGGGKKLNMGFIAFGWHYYINVGRVTPGR
jgi:hypothetical protein